MPSRHLFPLFKQQQKTTILWALSPSVVYEKRMLAVGVDICCDESEKKKKTIFYNTVVDYLILWVHPTWPLTYSSPLNQQNNWSDSFFFISAPTLSTNNCIRGKIFMIFFSGCCFCCCCTKILSASIGLSFPLTLSPVTCWQWQGVCRVFVSFSCVCCWDKLPVPNDAWLAFAIV